jgi:hypothetical protein
LKLLTTIFAFYILALSTIPCCVFDNCPEDKTELAQKDIEHKTGDEDGRGICSPFFNCGSCAVGFTNTVKYFELPTQPTLVSIPKKYVHFTQTLQTNSLSTIWQPPKNNV